MIKALSPNNFCWLAIVLAAGLVAPPTTKVHAEARSDEAINPARAKFNYQLFCQGCHTPDGSGFKSVPTMKGFVGHFLATPEGREYLVRVPGSANAALNDADLAEVLNWIILEFGGASVPADMRAYSAAEVGELRKDPLFEVVDYRKQLVADMALDKSDQGSHQDGLRSDPHNGSSHDSTNNKPVPRTIAQ